MHVINRITVRRILPIALGFALFATGVWWWTAGAASENLPSREEAGVSNHPLVIGKLKGKERDKRLAEFIEAERARKKEGKTLEDLYREFIDDLGVVRITQHLEKRDPFCHGEAHALGRIIAERAGDLRLGIAVCGDTCTYGCVHGVFKGHFVEKWKSEDDGHDHSGRPGEFKPVPIERIRQKVVPVCRDEFKFVRNFFRGNCAHSMGHALGGLGDPDVEVAVGYCAAFDEIQMRYYCETGIFMELHKSIETDLYDPRMTFEEKREAGVDFCLNEASMPSACMRFLLKANRSIEDGDRLAQTCLTLEGSRRRGCFNALGFLSQEYSVKNPRDVGRICRFGDLTDKELCVSGLVFVKKNNRKKEGLTDVCRYFDVGRLKDVCEDQQARFYYQVDNPTFNLMFADAS